MIQMDDPKPGQNLINLLGAALTGYLCGLLAYLAIALVNGTVNPTFRDVIIGLVGFITAKISTVFDWLYGTSSNSKKQQETIATQAATAAKAQDALQPIISAAAPTPQANAGADVVLQPGQHVDVAAVPLTKPADITQEAWELLTDADKTAEIARRAPAK